jgi:RNase P protein component
MRELPLLKREFNRERHLLKRWLKRELSLIKREPMQYATKIVVIIRASFKQFGKSSSQASFWQDLNVLKAFITRTKFALEQALFAQKRARCDMREEP